NGNNVGNPAYNTLNGSMNAGASSSVNAFVLTRQDIAATTTGYIAPASVTSPNDFEAYARSLMMSDENIVKIASNDNQVSVWYREPARFLGVIPMTVTVQAMVDAGGNVTVNYPWWYGVFVKDEGTGQFQSDLNGTAGTIARGEATTTLSSAAKARLVNALQSVMKSKYQSTAATSSSETTTY
ncbi:hypothetical protein KW799_02580, partial [Candidatus Parcubacteria bacterium]|nr:hypothetical protein [Candidatus Parcubacteria bacterium]